MIPLDRVRAPSLECTGASARWCPVCGDCTCGPRYEGAGADEERTLDDDGCPLHGASPQHAREAAPDLAAQVLALADALATAERERDTARASADRSAQAAVDASRELGHAAAQAVADRDAVRQAHATLAAAGREYLATDGDRPLDEAETHALDRLDALLSDAPAPSTVSAALVRAEHAELIECLLADRNALRAIVEGRTIAPSDAEIAAHAAAGGWWLLHSLGSHPGASSLAALALDAEQAQRAARVQRDRGEGAHRWHAMLDGRPCPWPVTP